MRMLRVEQTERGFKLEVVEGDPIPKRGQLFRPPQVVSSVELPTAHEAAGEVARLLASWPPV